MDVLIDAAKTAGVIALAFGFLLAYLTTVPISFDSY